MLKIINAVRCISNPYVRFGNQVAIPPHSTGHITHHATDEIDVDLRHDCIRGQQPVKHCSENCYMF
jgi:hypothetical protein